MENKKQHGGARKGAGRKPENSDKKMISMRAPSPVRELLDRLAKDTGKKKVEVFSEALEAYEKMLKSCE